MVVVVVGGGWGAVGIGDTIASGAISPARLMSSLARGDWRPARCAQLLGDRLDRPATYRAPPFSIIAEPAEWKDCNDRTLIEFSHSYNTRSIMVIADRATALACACQSGRLARFPALEPVSWTLVAGVSLYACVYMCR